MICTLGILKAKQNHYIPVYYILKDLVIHNIPECTRDLDCSSLTRKTKQSSCGSPKANRINLIPIASVCAHFASELSDQPQPKCRFCMILQDQRIEIEERFQRYQTCEVGTMKHHRSNMLQESHSVLISVTQNCRTSSN